MTDKTFPKSGRIAAVDFGSVRIGIAVCDPDRILASPLEIHPAERWRESEDYFRGLVKSEKLVGFIVGLPIHLDGGESQKSKECREFAVWLAEVTEMPTRLFDERFTTADAKQRIAGAGYTRKKKKDRIDAIAALVLLESFIEACRYRGEIAGTPVSSAAEGGESLDDESN
ncbi:putative Holliday junction resolvase [Rubripirellula amarantea]|uniref:Putative pre-16S rRNA nuclease n=1 Tax=Rubripirellula amarantea TaxID=2527999 RepID=A0A5C5WPC5_9BACT|nr:Holliday junction resolvase RuvX [Rubripirellula amarantea]TWT52704.1 putative Holliday junction resolvase [Rubripirellula amarantea]